MSLRTLAPFSLLLLLACGNQAPASSTKVDAKPAKADAKPTPAKRLPPGDPHAAPAPGSEDAKPPLMQSAAGTFDLTVDGKLAHYQRIPTGQNRAIATPDGSVARVSVAASKTDSGWPHVRLVLDGFRPDQAEYPMTLSSTSKDGPRVVLRYQVSERRIYQLDPDKGADLEVELEAFEGATLRGSFKGKVTPTAAGLGDPIDIQGKFSVELGLRDVEPGPLPGGATPTKDEAKPNAEPDAKAAPDEAKPDAKAPAKP